MLRKKEGFEGQRAIVLPRQILKDHCTSNPLISGAYITDIGYYPKAKFHYRERPHGSDQNIIIYCVEGKGWVTINGKETEYLAPGNFVIVPTGVPHKYAADEKNPWSIYWMHFKGDLTKKMIATFKFQPGDHVGYVSFQENRLRLFEDMYTNLEMGYGYDNLSYANMCLYYYLSTFLFADNYNMTAKKQSQSTINQSISFMKNHIDEMLTLADMASSVNLSASHFSFIFKKATGFPPIEYFNHLKVQKACQYLLFTELRIKEIAIRLGLIDHYYFSRMFAKVIGMSPATYRAKRIS